MLISFIIYIKVAYFINIDLILTVFLVDFGQFVLKNFRNENLRVFI